MSNAFAIAGVTAALKSALRAAVTVPDIDAALGGMPNVSALPPDRITPPTGADPNQLNLFLYAVTPNPGWINEQLPARGAQGERLATPPLALDLHYLLTAYASGELGAEILLAHGMQALHETPFFTRQRLRDILKDTPNEIPKVLETTGLAEQVESLKIAPKVLSWDDMSKIWTAVQGRYRPTAAYLVSVVLIDSRRSVRPTLPVLTRNVQVAALQHLAIDSLGPAADPAGPITAGTLLRLRGHGFAGTATRVFVGGLELTAAITRKTDTELDVPLPAPLPAGLRAGLTPAQVTQPVPGLAGFSSNVVGFSLRPVVTAVALAAGKLKVTLAPAVTKTQRVVLLLNERQPPAQRLAFAHRFDAPVNNGIAPAGTEAAVLTFTLTNVSPATYVVRVQVDGAESVLTTDAQGRFDLPKVTIP